MAVYQFSARNVDPAVALSPLPPADYPVIVTDSSEEQTEKGGVMLVLEMTVQPGNTFAGRKLRWNANVKNANPEAERISTQQLSALLYCIGRLDITKTEEIHGVPFLATATVNKTTGYNDVKGFKDINGNDAASIKKAMETGVALPSQQQQQQPQQTQYTQQQQPVQQQQQYPVSDDGNYMWMNNAWVPNTQQRPQQLPPPPAQQQQYIQQPTGPVQTYLQQQPQQTQYTPAPAQANYGPAQTQQPQQPQQQPVQQQQPVYQTQGTATQPAQQQQQQPPVQPGWSQQPGTPVQPGWVKA